MTVIHKYTLALNRMQVISMPKGAKILCVQLQRQVPCMWAEVPTNHTKVATQERTIAMYATGHDRVDPNAKYLGTVTFDDSLGIHVYEVTPKNPLFDREDSVTVVNLDDPPSSPRDLM